MKTKIKVTEADILRGIPRDPRRCMLARSIRKALHRRTVFVFPDDSYKTGTVQAGHLEIRLPVRANKNALRFDTFSPGGESTDKPVKGRARLKAIKPFSFTLQVPKSY